MSRLHNSIDLNCDLGEYELLSAAMKDAAIMPFISSCNIACGAHAGNQKVIEHTIALAIKNQVSMGAHPSYPDKANFGRKKMVISEQVLRASISHQISKVKTAVEAHGERLIHVKPHGALYNQAAIDLQLATLLCETVAAIDDQLMFYGLAHSCMAEAADQVGLHFVAEAFADRAYTANKTLVPRDQIGAVITDTEVMSSRVINMVKKQRVQVIDGEWIELKTETICLHGDHENSLQTAQALHSILCHSGVQIQAPNWTKS
jgi:UPF0271 protein